MAPKARVMDQTIHSFSLQTNCYCLNITEQQSFNKSFSTLVAPMEEWRNAMTAKQVGGMEGPGIVSFLTHLHANFKTHSFMEISCHVPKMPFL